MALLSVTNVCQELEEVHSPDADGNQNLNAKQSSPAPPGTHRVLHAPLTNQTSPSQLVHHSYPFIQPFLSSFLSGPFITCGNTLLLIRCTFTSLLSNPERLQMSAANFTSSFAGSCCIGLKTNSSKLFQTMGSASWSKKIVSIGFKIYCMKVMLFRCWSCYVFSILFLTSLVVVFLCYRLGIQLITSGLRHCPTFHLSQMTPSERRLIT